MRLMPKYLENIFPDNVVHTIVIFIILFLIAKTIEFVISGNLRVRKHKELRRDFDLAKIEKVTYQIRDLAIEYRREGISQDKMFEIGHSITARLDFLDQLLFRLFEFDESMRNATFDSYIKFSNACTGNDFLSKNSQKIPQLSKIIESNAYKLVDLTMRLRRNLPFEKREFNIIKRIYLKVFPIQEVKLD